MKTKPKDGGGNQRCNQHAKVIKHSKFHSKLLQTVDKPLCWLHTEETQRWFIDGLDKPLIRRVSLEM